MDKHAHGSAHGSGAGKCPFSGATTKQVAGGGTSNRDWWPNQLKLNILRQHSSLSNPMEAGFNYAEAFKKLDLAAVKQDIMDLMVNSQDCGLLITVTTGHFLSVWLGTVREPTEPEMVVEVQVREPRDLPL